jgi:hypothetical protein
MPFVCEPKSGYVSRKCSRSPCKTSPWSRAHDCESAHIGSHNHGAEQSPDRSTL